MSTAHQNAADAVGVDLHAYAAQAIDAARAPLLAQDLADELAIRAYRRAIKRWRAFLRLIAPLLDAGITDLSNEARGFARELAGARDSRAAIDALATCASRLGERTPATLRQRLDALGAAAEAEILTPATRSKLLAGLDRADEADAAWDFTTTDTADLAEQLANGYRRARQAIPEDWDDAEPEALHRFRQRVIVHRYQMELMEPAWPKFGKLWVDEAQRLRDRLGRFQDLEVLKRLTEPHQPLARWRAKLEPAIAERQARERRDARQIAGRLFADRPEAFRRRLAALLRFYHS